MTSHLFKHYSYSQVQDTLTTLMDGSLLLFKFPSFAHALSQWFPNFSDTRTTLKNLVVREAQNIDLYWELRTTLANLADHQWSAEQTLGITGLSNSQFLYTVQIYPNTEIVLITSVHVFFKC